MTSDRTAQQFYVYLRFSEVNGRRLRGMAWSREPQKWMAVLSAGCLTEYGERVVEFGYSEYPTSLNLRVQCQPAELSSVMEKLKGHFTGCIQIGTYVPVPNVTPHMQKVLSRTVVSILPFRKQAA